MSRYFDLLQRVEGMRMPIAEVPAEPVPVSETEYVPADPCLEMDSAIEEEISKMVQRVFLASAPAGAVIFCGADAGVGCSWVTACAAEILSRNVNATICAVDATGKYPTVHDYFGLNKRDYVSDTGSQRVSKRVWVATLRNSSPREHIVELRDQFDYLLIDAPPLRVGGDAISLAHDVDGAVLILEASVTHRETAKKAVRDMTAANVRVLGAVLNKRKFPIPAGLYNKL